MGLPRYSGTLYDDDSSYRRWKVDIDDFLYTYELYGFVDNSKPKPELPELPGSMSSSFTNNRATPPPEIDTATAPPTAQAAINASETSAQVAYKKTLEDYTKELATWKQMRHVTKMGLRKSVNDDRKDAVLNFDDPKEIYDTLIASGTDNNSQNLMSFMRALFSMKDQKHQTWEWKRRKMLDIKTQIHNIEERISLPDIFLAYLLIICAPNDEYSPSIDILLSKPANEITSDLVYTTFRRKETELLDPEILKAETVLAVRARQPPPGPNNSCSVCNSEDHFKKGCLVWLKTKDGKLWASSKKGKEYIERWGVEGKPGVANLVKKTKTRTQVRDGESDSNNEEASSYCPPRTYNSVNMMGKPRTFSPRSWLIDSACSHHISPRQDQFIEGTMKPCHIEVSVANDQIEIAKHYGDVRIHWKDRKGLAKSSILQNVYHMPSISSNLLSLGQFDKVGGDWKKTEFGIRLFTDKGHLFLEAKWSEDVLKVKIRQRERGLATRATPRFSKSELLHAKLGHPGNYRLSEYEEMVTGIEKGSLKDRFCEHCELAKSHRRPSKIPMRDVTARLERLHIDVYGPTQGPSVQGNKHMLTVTDQFSKMIWVFFSVSKKGMIETLSRFIEQRENECATQHNNEKVQHVRIDRGKELLNKKLEKLASERGFTIEATVGYTPEQNGMAEIANKIIMLKANTLRQVAGLGDSYWDLSAETACYLRNRGLVSKRLKTPWEIWYGRKPGMFGYRIFGCPSYVHIPKEKRDNKLAMRAWKGVFVGYDAQTEKIWKVWDGSQVCRVAHVVFDQQFTNQSFDQLWGANEYRKERVHCQIDQTDGSDDEDNADSDHVIEPEKVRGEESSRPVQNKEKEGFHRQIDASDDEDNVDSDHVIESEKEVQSSQTYFDELDEEDITFDTIEVLLPGEDLVDNGQTPEGPSSLSLAGLESMNLDELHQFLNNTTSELFPKKTLKEIKATIKRLEKNQKAEEVLARRHDVAEQRGDKRNPRRGVRDTAQAVAFKVALRNPGMIDIPLTVEEALDPSNPNCKDWARVLRVEVDGIIARGTLSKEIENLPPGVTLKDLMTAKVVFDVKYGENMEVLKFKARFVARGFSQQYGVNYDDTFAPTMGMNALRLLIALAAKRGWHLHQMDVVAAFLAGDLTEDVYMTVPEYFRPKFGAQVKILKSLYGLKQAARVWFLLLKKTLETMGFSSPHTDESVMVNEDTGIAVVFHVDDIVIAGKSMKSINAFKTEISSHFEMKDLGEARKVVGIRLIRHANGDISIDQSTYAQEIVNEFLYDNTKLYSTPMDPKAVTTLVSDPGSICAREVRASYLTLLGKLMWLCNTRPDITFAVHKLATFSSEPTCSTNHWKALLRVASYISGTLEYGIIYCAGEKMSDAEVARTQYYTVDHGLEIHSGTTSAEDSQTFSDADYATDPRDRKSVEGRISLVSGGAVTWGSTKQKSVTKSTTQAEYLGLSNAGREALWLREMISFLERIDKSEKDPPPSVPMIFGDNKAAIQLARGLSNTTKIKHVDTAFHHVLDETKKGNLKVFWVPGKHMLADGLTKPLPIASFVEKRSQAGMMPIYEVVRKQLLPPKLGGKMLH